MHKVWRGLGLVAIVLTLAGCPLLKKLKKGDQDAASDAAPPESSASASAAPEDAPPPPPPTAGPEASNEDDIERYEDETKLDHVSATTQWTVANVKTEAGGGDLVVVLKKGTTVSKIAERGAYTLVVFEDPADPDKKLMGWVGKNIFSTEVRALDAGRPRVTCKAGEGLLLLEGGDERCVTVCTSDAQCPRGFACTGDGPLSEKGQPGKIIRFCNIAAHKVHDAGAPPQDAGGDAQADAAAPSDAGAKDAGPVDAGQDAGAKADAGTNADAGAAKSLTAKKSAATGQCPTGYVPSGDICRLKCTTADDCGPNTKCTDNRCFPK